MSKNTKKSLDKVKKTNHKIKDSVFIDLFRNKKYQRELYLSLHPKDKDVKTSDIKKITLKRIVTEGIYNDLGLLVRNCLIILIEAQSTWSLNIIVRLLIYLGVTLKDYILNTKQDMYGSKILNLPQIELYVIYTGDKKVNDRYTFKEVFYKGKKCPVNIEVKVLKEVDVKKNDIISQYIKFSKMHTTYIKKFGNNKKTIKRLVDDCIKKNILAEYLGNINMEELIDMSQYGFSQKEAMEMSLNAREEKGRQEGIEQGMQKGIEQGMQKGMQQGMFKTIFDLVKKKLLKEEVAARELNMTVREFRSLMPA